MNRVYSFAIKLQDLFSPQMQRLATMYEQRTTFMGRAWSRFEGMLGKSSQTVSSLRSKLAGLGSGFKVKLDSSDVDKASTRTSGLLAKLKSVAGQSAIIGGLVGGGVMGVIDSAMAYAGQGYDKTVGAAQRNKTAMFSMDELMGKDTANTIVGQIDKYAPEKRDQLIAGANRLSGSGMVPGKIMGTLEALNNMAAVSNGKATVEDLAGVVAKVQAAGRIQGEEKEMLTDRGININPYLAKVMGVDVSQVGKLQEKGLITSDIFERSIQLMAGKGGKLDGAYERYQNSTPQGKQDVLDGRIDAIMRGIGDKMLPVKVAILDTLIETTKGTGPLVEIFQKLWSIIRPVWDGVIGLLQSFKILNNEGAVSQWVFDALGVAWDVLNAIFKVAGGVILGVSSLIGWLVDSKLTMLIIGIYGAAKAWGVLNAIMAMNPFSLAIIGIAALVTGIMYAWDKFDGFREAVLRVWETVKTVFSNIGLIIKTMFTGTVGDMIDLVKKTWNDGLTNGGKAVAADRANRIAEKQAKGKGNLPGIPGFDPLKPGKDSGSLASAAGLNSTAGNSKSSSVIINVKSLIEKSDIIINDFQGNYDELESKMIDTLLRIVNSGTRAVTA